MSVSIPHGGLRTSYLEYIKRAEKRSPSHTVGSEHSFPEKYLKVIFKSPSHPVGSEHIISRTAWYFEPESPSHPVGLERRRVFSYKCVGFTNVTIPHGGLGTGRLGAVFKPPKTTEEVCLHPTQWARNSHFPEVKAYRWSPPSHTVGLERVDSYINLVGLDEESPSHTVGLELRKTCFTASRLTEVSIPYSGLGTIIR